MGEDAETRCRAEKAVDAAFTMLDAQGLDATAGMIAAYADQFVQGRPVAPKYAPLVESSVRVIQGFVKKDLSNPEACEAA